MTQELIKEIRARLSASQMEMAVLLGVSFQTVNRWENGHALPNKLAETRLFELCKANGISLYDSILGRIRSEVEQCALPPGRVLLYHGSKAGIDGPIRPNSRAQCDFGPGFYMGTEAAQALTLVCDYDRSKLYVVSIDLTELRTAEIPEGIDWAMLVAFHRGKMETARGSTLYERYRNLTVNQDVLIGSIADDRMFFVLDNFFIGNINDKALVQSLSALKLGKQYAALTEKACEAICIEKEITLSYLERLFVKEAASENRSKGIALAKAVCKEYRREGRFFDEILADAEGGAR